MSTGRDRGRVASPHSPDAPTRCSTSKASAMADRPVADTLTAATPVAEAVTDLGADGVV